MKHEIFKTKDRGNRSTFMQLVLSTLKSSSNAAVIFSGFKLIFALIKL